MSKIDELEVGSNLEGFSGVITDVSVGNAKTGKFLSLKISDDSDSTIDAIQWSFEGDTPKLYDACALNGKVQISSFTGKKQIVISKLVFKTDLELARKFMKHSFINSSVLYEKMSRLLDEINDENLREFCKRIHNDFQDLIKEIPAAVNMHHNYYGGYAQHVYEVMSMAISMTNALKEFSNFDYNQDLIIAGSYLHDLGKLKSYCLDGLEPSMTFEGKLNDHIGEGVLMLSQLSNVYDIDISKWIPYLTNIILSHHENLEWGSPVKPSYPEALIIARADNMSASVEEMIDEVNELEDGEDFANKKSFKFGTRVHRPNL